MCAFDGQLCRPLITRMHLYGKEAVCWSTSWNIQQTLAVSWWQNNLTAHSARSSRGAKILGQLVAQNARTLPACLFTLHTGKGEMNMFVYKRAVSWVCAVCAQKLLNGLVAPIEIIGNMLKSEQGASVGKIFLPRIFALFRKKRKFPAWPFNIMLKKLW